MAWTKIISIISTSLISHVNWDYNDNAYKIHEGGLSYDLKNPKERWELPEELVEISGLSFFAENQLACVQDELGIFYVFDLKLKEIIRTEKFGKAGDYEGVEVIGNMAYVLKSDGDLYLFEIKKDGIGDVRKVKSELTERHDTEGLGFIQDKESLLVACKEEPDAKNTPRKKCRAVYEVKLEDMEFLAKPSILIGGRTYHKMLEKKGLSKKKHSPFKPSGIAIHPVSKRTFVISSVGKMLVILNASKEIEELVPLDKSIFRQPEGICFSPEGDLYISSEGKGKNAYILKF